jgi:hypothetical protein
MNAGSKSANLSVGASPIALAPASSTGQSMLEEAFTVDEFCKAHKLSRATFYNLLKIGLAPETMQPTPGGRRLISREAAAAWRRRMEAMTREAAAESPAA